MTMKYTIFALDDQSAAGIQRFHNFVAATTMTSTPQLLIGSWEGTPEISFIVTTEDFDFYLLGTCFVAEQECVMRFSECNKRYCELHYLRGEEYTGEVDVLGCLHTVSAEEAATHAGWSYRPDLGQFWAAKPGKPVYWSYRPDVGLYWAAKEGNPDRLTENVSKAPSGRPVTLSPGPLDTQPKL